MDRRVRYGDYEVVQIEEDISIFFHPPGGPVLPYLVAEFCNKKMLAMKGLNPESSWKNACKCAWTLAGEEI